MNSPFTRQMILMKFPPNSAGQMSLAGFTLDADKNGCVEVPRDLQDQAESHGLTVYVAPEPTGKK